MKALFLIQGQEVPSSRYRVLQFLPAWQEAGHEVIVVSHGEALGDIGHTLELAKECQVVFIHRKRLALSFVRRLKQAGCRLVYDVDDAVMFRDALHKKPKSHARQWRYKRLVKAVDQVIVGNCYIQEHTPVASQVMPTCLSLKHYESAKEVAESEKPTLVWIGDTGSIHYLKKLAPILEKVGEHVEGCRLKIICDTFFDLKNMEVIKIPWNQDTEVAELADSQVGLMPLAMDPWSQGKCALKFLQYLAVARPAVVTPAGMNNDLLAMGECGFKAITAEEWVRSLVTLLGDKNLRQRQGARGQELVREHFSLEARQKEWVSLVSGI